MANKILLIDDDSTILEAVKLVLENEGYKILASSNTENIGKLIKKAPDLILIDLLLAGVDSREIIVRLKEKSDTKSIPVIVFSAFMNAREVALKAGADDFLAKPFELVELIEIVDRNLKKRTNK